MSARQNHRRTLQAHTAGHEPQRITIDLMGLGGSRSAFGHAVSQLSVPEPALTKSRRVFRTDCHADSRRGLSVDFLPTIPRGHPAKQSKRAARSTNFSIALRRAHFGFEPSTGLLASFELLFSITTGGQVCNEGGNERRSKSGANCTQAFTNPLLHKPMHGSRLTNIEVPAWVKAP